MSKLRENLMSLACMYNGVLIEKEVLLIHKAIEYINELEAENAELKRDSDRYNLLVRNLRVFSDLHGYNLKLSDELVKLVYESGSDKIKDSIDYAIDAAMRGEK